MTDLPPGWVRATLGEVVEPRSARTLPVEGDERPFLGLEDVEPHSGRVLRWREAAAFRSAALVARPGDVLYGRLRPYLNKVARADKELLVSGEFIVLAPSAPIDGPFLHHLLLSPRFLKKAVALSGGDRPRAKWRDLQHFAFDLPPRGEQRRIVAAIEEHLSRLDAADAALQSARGRLDRLLTNSVPAPQPDWPIVTIAEVGQVFVGSTPPRSNPGLWGGPVAWVSSGEVAFCRITSTRETITLDAVRAERIHPPGTVLIAMIGEGKTRGQAAILDIPAAHNQNSAAIRPDTSRLTPEWLYHMFRQQYAVNRRLGSGNNQPALNKSRIEALRIPLPSLSEQRELVERADALGETAARLASHTAEMARRSDALRRAILSAAFSGRLTPQDPNDEPASVLLEQTRAERAAEPPRSRMRKVKAS